LNAESVPLLDGGAGAAAAGLGLPAPKGLLSPVTGLVGSAPGTVKGVLGTGTNTLNGLLGGTPLGPLVGGIGNIGTGAAGGLLDSVGSIGSSLGGATGGLGLGNILKPVTGTVGGVLGGLPIVGPIAGGLTDTVGGLNLAQINPLNVAADPSMVQYPGPGMGAPVPAGASAPMQFATQAVEEKVVGNLGTGSFLTNTGRIVSLLPTGGAGGLPSANLPQNPLGAIGNGNPLAGVGGLTGQIPAGLAGNLANLGGLGGLGQTLQPITSNPLAQGAQGALSDLPLGQLSQGGSPLDLANIVAKLPPGLSQIVQPVGSAEKFLQIGQRIIPLGALDNTQLAQLGLDKLPISAVNGIPGVPAINYLQDQPEAGAEGEEESKEVKANPVTAWIDGTAPSNSTEPATTPTPSSTTPPDATVPAETSAPVSAPAESSTSVSADPSQTEGAQPTDVPTGLPVLAKMNVQPLYVAPTDSNARAAPGSSAMPKGFTQWSEVNLNEGETFDRIADGMSGREKNYYAGSDKLPSTTSSAPVPSAWPTSGPQNSTIIDDGPRDPGPDFHANKGRVGWQLVDVEDGSEAEPSSTSGHWHRVSETGTPSASANIRAASSAVGDWVSAGMDDMGLNGGWDDSTTYEPSPTAVSHPAASSNMASKHSAGLS
jgi:hypothetical protein